MIKASKKYGYFDIQVRSELEYYEMRGNEDHCIKVKWHTSKQKFLLKYIFYSNFMGCNMSSQNDINQRINTKSMV